MNTVLMIAYYFPPLGGGGVQRTAKFARYLHEFGWRPVILSVSDPAFHVFDDSLLAEMPAGLPVYRVQSVEPTSFYYRLKRRSVESGYDALAAAIPTRTLSTLLRRFGRRAADWVFIPDEQIGWAPFAIRAALDVIRQHGVRVIYSTSTPFSAHLIGARLQQRTGLPWVADFRDPFARNRRKLSSSPMHVWLRHKLEHDWVIGADRVISTTSAMSHDFAARYPQLPADRWITIPNGYDEHDFAALAAPAQPSGAFELRYVGSLYKGHSPDPLPLLRAVRALQERDPRGAADFRLSFTGALDATLSQQLAEGIAQLGLSDRVSIHPPVPHHEAIRLMHTASALLLMASRRPMSELIVHGKTYEYLRARQPILALNAAGAHRQLLETTDAAVFLRSDDSEGIYRQLQTWLDAWRCGELRKPVNAGHERFERRALTCQLASLFSQLMPVGEATPAKPAS